jgi:sialate O-acetylesterase
MKSYFFIFSFVFLSLMVRANVKPNSLFTNNAVFQRGVEVPVWGKADDNEKVTVEFNGQKLETVAVNGKWLVKLKPMKENATPQNLIISGNNTLTFKNILIGEVWLCSGQSNMERQLGLRPFQKPILNWQAEAKDAANYPQIRQFAVPRNPSAGKVEDVNGKWAVCDSITVKSFTAVGFFFGRFLAQKLNVPIGLLFSAVGGTPAEKWTSRECLELNPALKNIVDNYEKSIIRFPEALKKYKLNEDSLIATWKRDTTAARIANKPQPRKPSVPVEPTKSGDCGGLFNGMISPLIPYAMKGVIWYQGEANCNREKQYQTLFPAMIADWRQKWNIGDFPFLFVQLAPFRTNTPELREAQLLTSKTVNKSAMVVTLDCGDTLDIHPANKKPVGQRLALAARALAYGETKLEYSGPVYESVRFTGKEAEITFSHSASGLVAKDGNLTGFSISSDGKKFVQAKAIIKNNKVIVSSDLISTPQAVRYAFRNCATGNLFNKEGLPASPFRTDVQ